MSRLITFEGIEGSGKSTQARRLWRRLTRAGIPAVLTHEPGGTDLSDDIRRILKKPRATGVVPRAELLLFEAARAQLTDEVLRPALAGGRVVICDRYVHSTIAYQCYGRGLDRSLIDRMNEIATQGLQPDLAILLDVEAQTGLGRKKGSQNDRFESEALAFHRRVRQGYLALAAADPERWLVVDGAQPPAATARAIWQRVSPLLGHPSAPRER